MSYVSINPFDGKIIHRSTTWTNPEIEAALQQSHQAQPQWAALPTHQRSSYLHQTAAILLRDKNSLALTISQEMGKLIGDARGEVEKCALVCQFYADHSTQFLQPEIIASDASKSYVAYPALGTILAIMPWNFPFWQVFRFAAPALAAGNTALLKHASNVGLCAQAIENVFKQAGLPRGVFTTLMVSSAQINPIIADPRVQAVTLTGSESAGRAVAAHAGRHLKKTVLELGGSDAFIVLEDADLDLTLKGAVASRFLNNGQSCIAAKRFIVVGAIANTFIQEFARRLSQLKAGDPVDEKTTLAPMAREDLRTQLHAQVSTGLKQGAKAVCGCQILPGPGFFYAPSILDQVNTHMDIYHEEVFGPVALVIRAENDRAALDIANDSAFGLGGSIWSRDAQRAENMALQLQTGCAFVNGVVKSDPRLPFGGIKNSGYGRELSQAGIREFVNTKTIWIK